MNSYITKSLENDEKVVLRGRYHWTFTASKIICAWIFAIASVALLIATRYYPEYKTTLLVMAASAMVLALINTLWGYILRSRTEFAVTDTRFIQKDGAEEISDFRPISLIHAMAKIHAQIILLAVNVQW